MKHKNIKSELKNISKCFYYIKVFRIRVLIENVQKNLDKNKYPEKHNESRLNESRSNYIVICLPNDCHFEFVGANVSRV